MGSLHFEYDPRSRSGDSTKRQDKDMRLRGVRFAWTRMLDEYIRFMGFGSICVYRGYVLFEEDAI